MADRKMSLNELSEKVGIANVNLSKIKTGKISAIRFSTLDAICRGMKRRGFDGFATMEIVFHDWTLDQAFDYAVSSRELFLKHWAEA